MLLHLGPCVLEPYEEGSVAPPVSSGAPSAVAGDEAQETKAPQEEKPVASSVSKEASAKKATNQVEGRPPTPAEVKADQVEAAMADEDWGLSLAAPISVLRQVLGS